jgi:hypothetical protein
VERKPAFSGIFALCLIALQVVTALHFALVPHAFNSTLSGFVHVHARAAREAGRAEALALRTASAPAFEHESVSCVGDSCPIGFAGPHSTLIVASRVSALLGFDLLPALAPIRAQAPARNRVLLSAPKTSPPV